MSLFDLGWTRAVGVVMIACSGVPLSGCGSAPAELAPLGPAVPYVLNTHCGVSEARYQDRYYELVPPLDDGSGNPPDDWGNLFQRGTLTPVSETEVVFTDDAGHRVIFTLRPGATTWMRLCN